MSTKTLIIGGVAGGATAAARLRRKDETMEIILFEKGNYISYANCGLPYYIGDVIKQRESLLLQTPETMKKKYNIDVRIRNEVIKIIPKEKKVIVKNHTTDEQYEEQYDKLIISTGSSPLKPPISGIDAQNIFHIWNVNDTDAIKSYIYEKKPRTAAVIGGGFIGLEMAENLHAVGLQVSLIEMQNQVMPPFDYEMAALLHHHIKKNNINLILNNAVQSFQHENTHTNIILSDGRILQADLIIVSAGIKPNTSLLKDTGIILNQKGGIIVDDSLKTSVENIYAAGDAIEVKHYITNKKTMIPLAAPANKQARLLADNLTGGNKTYKGTLGTSIAKIFDLHAASTGINEKQLKEMGKIKNKDYFTVLINQNSHATYYPNASLLTLKIIFDADGKLFGAQIIGKEGVDKRIDVLSSVMKLNGTIYDLGELELSYAPPFSSAKDPINMLGFVAENILDGLVQFMEYDELKQLLSDQSLKETYTVLDVTESYEHMLYSIPNAYHIPLGELRNRMHELDQDKKIIIYCAIGVRSYNASRILSQNGFDHVFVLSGGTIFYKNIHE